MPVQIEETEDYKTKYKNLKRKLKVLIYENECFQEELRSANRALLRVKQDKSFLLDQLLPHHQQPVSSSDSDLTDNSDTEAPPPPKRKRIGEANDASSYQAVPKTPSSPAANSSKPPAAPSASTSSGAARPVYPGNKPTQTAAAKKKPIPSIHRPGHSKPPSGVKSRQRRVTPKQQKSPVTQVTRGEAAVVVEPELSREEVERHLLARQPIADFNTPVSLTLPHQLFSDTMMDGEILSEDMETSPSNMEEEISVDNYE